MARLERCIVCFVCMYMHREMSIMSFDKEFCVNGRKVNCILFTII